MYPAYQHSLRYTSVAFTKKKKKKILITSNSLLLYTGSTTTVFSHRNDHCFSGNNSLLLSARLKTIYRYCTLHHPSNLNCCSCKTYFINVSISTMFITIYGLPVRMLWNSPFPPYEMLHITTVLYTSQPVAFVYINVFRFTQSSILNITAYSHILCYDRS